MGYGITMDDYGLPLNLRDERWDEIDIALLATRENVLTLSQAEGGWENNNSVVEPRIRDARNTTHTTLNTKSHGR